MRRLFLFICSLFSSLVAGASEEPMRPEVYACRQSRKVILEEARRIAKDEDLAVVASGLGRVIDVSFTPWGLVFTSKKKLLPDEARQLAIKVQTRLLDFVHKEPIFATYYRVNPVIPGHPEHSHVSPFSVVLKIAFWDEEVNRPERPYVADVRIFNNEVHCFFANPKTKALEDPIVTPFSYSPPSLLPP